MDFPRDGLGNVVLPTIRAVQTAPVVKQGVSTGITYGSVDGVSEDISIMYNGDASCCAVLAGQIAIVGNSGSFSDEGDSGALVRLPALQPMGLLVGGSQTTADIRHQSGSNANAGDSDWSGETCID
jgi:hypothetical protein